MQQRHAQEPVRARHSPPRPVCLPVVADRRLRHSPEVLKIRAQLVFIRLPAQPANEHLASAIGDDLGHLVSGIGVSATSADPGHLVSGVAVSTISADLGHLVSSVGVSAISRPRAPGVRCRRRSQASVCAFTSLPDVLTVSGQRFLYDPKKGWVRGSAASHAACTCRRSCMHMQQDSAIHYAALSLSREWPRRWTIAHWPAHCPLARACPSEILLQ